MTNDVNVKYQVQTDKDIDLVYIEYRSMSMLHQSYIRMQYIQFILFILKQYQYVYLYYILCPHHYGIDLYTHIENHIIVDEWSSANIRIHKQEYM